MRVRAEVERELVLTLVPEPLHRHPPLGGILHRQVAPAPPVLGQASGIDVASDLLGIAPPEDEVGQTVAWFLVAPVAQGIGISANEPCLVDHDAADRLGVGD